MSTRLRQTAVFKVAPHEVYEALLDQEKHAQFTDSKVKINRRVGGDFSIFGGEIHGVTLELVPDRKIVQSWRYSDWPIGNYSVVTFELKEIEGGTRLVFTQTDIPEYRFEDIKEGWKEYYWKALKAYFKKKS